MAASAGTKNSASPVARIRSTTGKINSNYYRGAQPEDRDYKDLAAFGVRTVIDLTRDGRANEQRLVEQAGMRFYRIPMTTSEKPSAAAVAQFLKLVNDPASQPVFVHCQGGRHRTGVMTAVYRMTQDNWTAERAYQEMKQYRFEGFPGHPALKKFVYDYYSRMDRSRIADGKCSESRHQLATPEHLMASLVWPYELPPAAAVLKRERSGLAKAPLVNKTRAKAHDYVPDATVHPTNSLVPTARILKLLFTSKEMRGHRWRCSATGAQNEAGCSNRHSLSPRSRMRSLTR
jgi:protein tyrosine phosphatase (PTP) superfamily phosphohydrolase (DUF442 family)